MKKFPVAGCLALLPAGGGIARDEETVIAGLAGRPVPADEYAFHADQLRTEVASRLMAKHGVTMYPGFWTTELDGVKPEDVLRAETLRRIARFQVVQELALENGLIEAVLDYAGMLAAFNEENLRRREMKEAGEVFYGPVQFRQDVYFNVRLEQLVRGLLKIKRTQEGTTGDAALREGLEVSINSRIESLLNPNTPFD